jgi:ribosome biogenesis GTPase / thiamine phosphate phosphatase
LINQFGWSDALSQQFAPFAEQGLVPGRVVVQHRGQYDLVTPEGEAKATISGRFAHEAGEGGYPVTGDWVGVSLDAGAATIHAVLPRRTAFIRKAAGPSQTPQVVAANVDAAVLVSALTPDFNPRRLERYLAIAWQSGARPLVVLTKADLCPDVDEAVAATQAMAVGVDVIAVSAATGDGMADLASRLLPGETAVLVGSSGAGKSTLVNALAGEARMAVGEVREEDGRGRHTTSHRELVLLPGGALILDTPGMRELGLMDADEGITATFEDIDALAEQCRFHDCGHTNEPGCAIAVALETGVLDPARWGNYQKLQREAAFSDRKEDRMARLVERRKWVTIAKAQRANRKRRERPE